MLGYSSISSAVELSDITVKSYLNEQFSAYLLMLETPDNLSLSDYEVDIKALAPTQTDPENHRYVTNKIEIRKTKILKGIRIDLQSKFNLDLPILRFSISARTPKVRLQRNYTIFMDPKLFISNEGAFSNSEKKINPGSNYGPVKHGENLISISRKVKTAKNIPFEKIVFAVASENPMAFKNGNVNELKKGAFIHVPSESVLLTLPLSEAFKFYKKEIINGSSTTDNENHILSEEILNNNELIFNSVSQDTAESDSYVLRLPQSYGTAKSSGLAKDNINPKEMPTQIDNAQKQGSHDSDYKNIEINENNDALKSKIVLLEKKLKKTDDLIRLQETQLRIAEQQLQTILDANRQREASKREKQSIENGNAELLSRIIEESESNATNREAKKNQSSKDISGNQLIQIPSAETTYDISLTQEVGSAGYIEKILRIPGQIINKIIARASKIESNNIFIIGLSLIIIILLIIKKNKSKKYTKNSFLYKKDAKQHNGENIRSPINTKVSENFSNEESLGAGFVTDVETQRGVAVKSDEVDPLAEAEIYLAYGRGEQAEETLRYAINRNPGRVELKIKMLEVYRSLSNKISFDKLVKELSEIIDPESSEWTHVVDIATSYDQSNKSLLENVNANVKKENPKTLGGIDFELDSDDYLQKEENESFNEEDTLAESITPIDDGIEFNIEPDDKPVMDIPSNLSVSIGESIVTPEVEASSDVDLDIDDSETQIALAQTYLDIGDIDGALELLESVITKSDGDTRTRAEKIYSQIKANKSE